MKDFAGKKEQFADFILKYSGDSSILNNRI
jgi:hypothetical protein